jgi:exopolysaccharide biosynthesis polyprenyl glycosylphosphotransferase
MKKPARLILLLMGDLSALGIAFLGMLFISFREQSLPNMLRMHSIPFLILAVLWIVIFFIFNLYNPHVAKPTIPHLRQIFMAFTVALVTGMLFFYLTSYFDIAPKTNLVIFAVISLVFFTLWRRIFYSIFASYFRKGVIFIVKGAHHTDQVKYLESYIATNPQSGFVTQGVYNSLEQFQEGHKGGVPDVFIVSREVWQEPNNFKILHGFESEVLDLAQAYEDILVRVPIEAIDESWFMHNVMSYEENIYDLIKQFVDKLVAIFILIILSPLFLLIALAIKLYDGGPILYSQTRIGKDNKNFKLFKFRSMLVNAEENGPAWAAKNDTRVTPVGKIFRKLHVDELPQMFNVIRGDLALVGPRPEQPAFVEQLEKEIPFYHLRHIITPGFTGWAQIKFRYASNVMDSKEKFEYDLYYLKNRNFFMDLGIIIRTIQIIFTH